MAADELHCGPKFQEHVHVHPHIHLLLTRQNIHKSIAKVTVFDQKSPQDTDKRLNLFIPVILCRRQPNDGLTREREQPTQFELS